MGLSELGSGAVGRRWASWFSQSLIWVLDVPRGTSRPLEDVELAGISSHLPGAGVCSLRADTPLRALLQASDF